MGKHALVVGGGVCGIMAAIKLKQHFANVTLIEQSAELGGLFRSISDTVGNHFDMGAHIPNATNIAGLDNILFGNPDERSMTWNVIDKLKSGHYFQGSLNLKSPFPDSKKLPAEIYNKGCGELIQSAEIPDSRFIIDYSIKTLGSTFTEHIVIPILKKLYGDDIILTDLTLDAGLFGFLRILAFEPEIAKVLKLIPAFDAKLGYQLEEHFIERQAMDSSLKPPQYFYPSGNLGIQKWVDYLAEKATDLGVQILCNQQIEKINLHDTKVSEVCLRNTGATINIDCLFWSAPPSLALNAMGLSAVGCKPLLRTTLVFHFSLDRAPLDNTSHYLWVWDSSTSIFRVTLYYNLALNDKPYTLSAEILCDKDEVHLFDHDSVFADLKRIGIISECTIYLTQIKQVIHNTFPVPTQELEYANRSNCERLKNAASNIIISGRFSGKHWRQADVLVAAFRSIDDYLGIG